MNIKQSDIIEMYRVGKPNEKKKHRDTIITFRKKTTRDMFYQNRKNITRKQDQENQVYINELLTKHRANIFFGLRTLMKEKQIHAAWSQKGNILIRKTESDPPRKIRSLKQLKEFEVTREISDGKPESDAESSDEEQS